MQVTLHKQKFNEIFTPVIDIAMPKPQDIISYWDYNIIFKCQLHFCVNILLEML